MNILVKMIAYVSFALLLSAYFGLEPERIMPDALKDFDSELGEPIHSALSNVHTLGEAHIGQAMDWLSDGWSRY